MDIPPPPQHTHCMLPPFPSLPPDAVAQTHLQLTLRESAYRAEIWLGGISWPISLDQLLWVFCDQFLGFLQLVVDRDIGVFSRHRDVLIQEHEVHSKDADHMHQLHSRCHTTLVVVLGAADVHVSDQIGVVLSVSLRGFTSVHRKVWKILRKK